MASNELDPEHRTMDEPHATKDEVGGRGIYYMSEMSHVKTHDTILCCCTVVRVCMASHYQMVRGNKCGRGFDSVITLVLI